MQNWWKKVICAGLVGVSVLASNYAEAGVPNKFPLQCYSAKKVITYNEKNGASVGWIAANLDLIRITEISGEWARGTYPTSNGTSKPRWFRLSDIVPNLNFSNYETGMYRASKAYRTESSGTVLGTVYANDTVTVVYRGSNRSQVIYPVSGGYKMGWVNNNDIRQTNSNNSLTDVSGYREFSAIEKNAYLNKKTSKKAEIYNDPDLRTRAGLYWGPGATLGVVGMTSKAFKVEYSYGGTGRVGWVTKDIYDMVDQVSRPSKPSNFSINTNKTSYNVGETIQFNFSSTGADELYIPIDINGKREHFINVTGRNSYSMQATTPGTYNYTLYGRNKNGEYNVAYKAFSVNGINWDTLVNSQLANINSDNYRKPINSFDQSYTSSKDGKYHRYNCTWYAWGRMREVTGKSIEFNGGRNAKQWRDNTTNCNHVSLQDKCVAVTQQGGGGNGHVVFVEHVGNEYVYYTEANVNDSTDLKVRKAQINTFLSKYTTFLK